MSINYVKVQENKLFGRIIVISHQQNNGQYKCDEQHCKEKFQKVFKHLAENILAFAAVLGTKEYIVSIQPNAYKTNYCTRSFCRVKDFIKGTCMGHSSSLLRHSNLGSDELLNS